MDSQRSTALHEARGLVAAFDGLAAACRAIATTELDTATRARDEARVVGREQAARARHELEQRIRAEAERHVRQLRTMAPQLAPGALATPFDADHWEAANLIGAHQPRFVRVGALANEPSVPAVLPLFGSAGWLVRSTNPDHANRLIRLAVLRALASAPPMRMGVIGFDPSVTGVLGLLGALRVKTPELVGDAGHTTASLNELMSRLKVESASRSAVLAQFGVDSYLDLPDLAAPDPMRLLVVANYPTAFDEKAHRELVQLVDRSASRGITVLVHHNPAVPAERGVDPAELERHLLVATVDGDRASAAPFHNGTIALDAVPDHRFADRLGTRIATLAAKAALPILPFESLLPPRELWWGPVRAADGLSVDLAKDGVVTVPTRLRSSNTPAHMLVGGASGMGKSNFLNVLIHGLAVRYSPDDLEMYLLDFKGGTEFAVLGPGPNRRYWLPHARVLALQADPHFGAAVLQHLVDEMTRREALFKQHGAKDIDAMPSSAKVPRIVAVLDEFQVLLEGDNASEAAALLNTIARKSRSFGIHIVLATQSISGVRGLAVMGGAILGQMHSRVVFKTKDSSSFLDKTNDAAAHLRFRGQAIFNEELGSAPANRTVLVAFADANELDHLRKELHLKRAGQSRPPRIFESDQPADLVLAADRFQVDKHKVWGGMSVAVDEYPVESSVRNAGLVVLGMNEELALGSLVAAAYCVQANDPDSEFVILDCDSDNHEPIVTAGRLALRALLPDARWVDVDDCGAELDKIAGGLPDRSRRDRTTTVLGLGMHLIAGLPTKGTNGNQSIGAIVRTGPNHGVTLHGWWDDRTTFKAQTGFPDPVVPMLLLTQRAVSDGGGPLAKLPEGPHRAMLRTERGELAVVVTFGTPTADAIKQLTGSGA